MTVLLVVVSVLCEENDSSIITKREASIGSYSYTSSDISKYDGSHVKTLTVLKSLEMPKHEDSEFIHKKMSGKTTVEFWPPNMDKKKFFSMRGEDSSMEFWPKPVNREVVVMVEKSSSERLPDIPAKTKTFTYEPELQEMVTTTETVIYNDISITNSGPVVFPTSLPTTKGPDRDIVYIPRNSGNKKRKLKKKAKPAVSAVVVTSEAIDPVSISVNGVNATNEQKVPDATPIYETIDEPPQDIFPIRYTDVINNLSNLTELTYGNKRANNSDNKIIDAQQPIDNAMSNFNVSESESNNKIHTNQTSRSLNASRGSRRRIPSKPLSMEDLTPLEKLFEQLKNAIDERDVAMIKNIVRLMEEPEPVTEAAAVITTEISTKLAASPSTTEVISSSKLETTASSTSQSSTKLKIEETSTSQASTLMSTSLSEDSTTTRSKIYLAPRVRLAQKKLKDLKEITLDEKLQSSATETIASTSVRPTTERLVITTSSLMPTRRRSRSHITPRIRSIAARSRQAAKNKINRRIGRRVA